MYLYHVEVWERSFNMSSNNCYSPIFTTMGSNDLVVGEDHMAGPTYRWHTGRQTGRCGTKVSGSSPRRRKTLNSKPADLRKYLLVEDTSGGNLEKKSGVDPLKVV